MSLDPMDIEDIEKSLDKLVDVLAETRDNVYCLQLKDHYNCEPESLNDRIATAAMTALLHIFPEWATSPNVDQLADKSYEIAEAMIAAKARYETPPKP